MRYTVTVFEGDRPMTFGGNRSNYLGEAGRIAWMLAGRALSIGADPISIEIHDSAGEHGARWAPPVEQIRSPLFCGTDFLPGELK